MDIGKNKYNYLVFILVLMIGALLILGFYYSKEPVRIGFFRGGRVNIIYRTSVFNYFDNEGVEVNLYTKVLKGEEILEVPKSESERISNLEKMGNFGKMSGIEIVDKMMEGEFDGGTIGESSFIASINKGLPIIAVAQLGYDAVPGKAIIMRDDVEINSTDDLRGKTLISKRAGPGDETFLKEFLKDIGLEPGKDLTVINQVDEDDAKRWLKEGKIDGGLYHLQTTRQLVLSGDAYVYRPMNWMNPQLSQAVLVFRKDYIESHEHEVENIVRALVKRIAYEKNLPDEEKDRSWNPWLMMEGEFQGMKIPTYDLPPKIRTEILDEMQDLLFVHGKIDKKVNINDFVDHSFVDRAMNIIE